MTKKILILPGDGIGQEVTSSAKEVLDFLIDEYQLNFEITNMDVGGTAYEKFGSPLPDNVLEEAKKSDAILFGAVGGPQWDDLGWDYRPEQALLGLRKELELFANLRPAFLFNELASASPIKNHIIENLDILIVRELTGGVYFGEPRAIVLDDPTPYAFNTMIYNEDEIRRIAKVAFESAQKRNGKLCSVEKANVLEVSKFWRSIVSDMAKDYPDVELTHQLADNTAMQLVLNPNQFDVIVSGNLFGDILSDIAATLTGSIGMLPSASLNSSSRGMYEPCHGSAPDIAGQNIANPIAMIASLAMALRFSLNETGLADKIDDAIKQFIALGFRTKDISTTDEYMSTSEVATKIIEIIKNG
ncbi:3-isopropylmalate dehydrogenase [Gammaproteobacteria bacterium]|jgi:3-isopropylmalate dehydrogenase|nr:3-isopropylmalate dehydrogenase [Gammaproteobacteria bacterium]MDB2582637.1 3-isopropylmalate dehydrogenase [Gammaproteobacteria bacterium]MDB4120168.1 3-isopropylmalate dehydrogenase [Gammaproteobacteria bacterium]MDB4136007.1 3-isopropylmalate dehydrogenase [Gammaproteobacteria bacterium]